MFGTRTRVPVAALRALVLLLVGGLMVVGPAFAQTPGFTQIPGVVPSASTPGIDNGLVYSITQIGNTVVVGGTFTSLTPPGGSSQPRSYVAGFDAGSGALSSFAPSLNGDVQSVAPGPTSGTVYVAGSFTQANGVATSHVGLFNLSNGSLVTTFRAATTNGIINTVKVNAGRLFIGGNFTTVGGAAHGGIASLNATTGAIDASMSSSVTGHHNDSGSGAQGSVGVRQISINPQGDRLVAIGNFKQVNGLSRDQLVMFDLTSSSATVDQSWATTRYTPYCFNWAFDTYMRGVDFSPDGSYFVVAATGGHNAGTLCDTASRFETHAQGLDIQPTWVDDAGGDTLWGVSVTETAVFVGGHQRWMNNTYGSDSAAAGAVPRPGLAALDTLSGRPVAWNPGRNPRGYGAYAVYATPAGLWVGSDTEWIGNFQYKRPRIAFFPLSQGAPQATQTTQSLPGDVYIGSGSGGLAKVPFDGTTAGQKTPVDALGINWANVRGAFELGNTLYYGSSDGYLYKTTFTGTTATTPVRLDPYHDPYWANVQTGSGNTYNGVASGLSGELANVTGMFFTAGRVYYTLSGNSHLLWRWFNPDSGIAGDTEYDASNGIDWTNTGGLFYANSNLYVVSSTTGALSKIAFTGGQPVGQSTPVNVTNDWRGTALFLLHSAATNQPPTASFTTSCTGLSCNFDASASSDQDGTISSYAWDFGDGSTGTGKTAGHTFAAPGTYHVKLTVTDNGGATGTQTHDATVQQQASPVSFVASNGSTANSTTASATVPSAVAAGDRLLMFTTIGVLADGVAAPSGWTLVGTKDNSSMTTYVWTKAATAGDAGAKVSVTLPATAKSSSTIAAYRGVSASTPIGAQASATDSASANHVSPTVQAAAGNWVLQYWSIKSSTASTFTVPGDVTSRTTTTGTGSGYAASVLADSAGLVAGGTVGGETTTTSAASAKGIAWTLTLVAGP